MRFPLAACVLLIGTGVAVACDCAPPPAPKKAMEGAEAVFLGVAVEVEVEGQTRTVKLKVDKWWKGGDAAEMTVSTHKSGATCGYGFERGEKYLVYAHREEKQKLLRVSLCSRTRTEKEAEKDGDFKELGEGKKPEAKQPVGLAAFVEAARLQNESRERAAIEYSRAIQRAYDAWQADETRQARDLLDGIPSERRGWEWFHLRPRPKQ